MNPALFTALSEYDGDKSLEDFIKSLGKKVEEKWDQWNNDRDWYNKAACESMKAYNMLSILDDGHAESVSPWKHGMVLSNINAWTDNITQLLFPDIDFIRVETPPEGTLPQDNSGEKSDAQIEYKKSAEKLMDEIDFNNKAWIINRDAALFFGSMVRVYAEEYYDPFLNVKYYKADFKIFDWDDYIMDAHADSPEEATKIMQWFSSKSDLKSKASSGMYDEEAVKEIIEKNMTATGNERDFNNDNDRSIKASKDQYVIRELIGTIVCDDYDIPSNIIITECNGIVLRAILNDSPRGVDPCVFFGLYKGADNTIYPISLGYLLTEYQRKADRLLTYVDLGTSIMAAPPMMIDIEMIEEFGEDFYQLTPFATWPFDAKKPNSIQPLQLDINMGPAQSEVRQLEQRVEMITGITTPIQGGQMDPKVTPTLANLQEKGSTIRLNQYVEKLQKSYSELLNKLMLFKYEFNKQEFRARLSIDGITDNKISLSKLQTHMSALSVILNNQQMAGMLDYKAILVDLISMMVSNGTSPEKYILPPPPPPPTMQAPSPAPPPEMAPPGPVMPPPEVMAAMAQGGMQ